MTGVTAQLTIRLLGAPDARIAGVPLALHKQKARALLYYLAATGRSHTRDHLASLLLTESPDSNARHSLRSSLYHIRHALHTQRADQVLVGDVDLDSLDLQYHTCDLTHSRRLLVESSDKA